MLYVKNLHFSYNQGKVFALQNINFKVQQNTITGIAGHSGSGKSTLLHCLFGKNDLQKGEINFNGQLITGPSKNLITGHKDMELVNQLFKVEKEISAEENILRKMLGYNVDYKIQRTNQLLNLCGLNACKNHKPGSLSGGQQQLLSICMALAVNPKLLLLDEPFSHLDAITKTGIIKTLVKLKKKPGLSLIIVSHDAQDLLSLCDSILILKNGKLIEEDKPELLYNQAKYLYTYKLFGPINHLHEKHPLSKKHKSCFIRPEKLKPAKTGYTVRVVNCFFYGTHYFIEAKGEQNENIYLHSNLPVIAGEILRVI